MLGFLISFVLFACFQCRLIGQPFANLPSPHLCDCIRVPGTNRCLKYDNRLQAQNLNEAIGFFEDLSLLDETKPAQRLNRDSIGGCTSKDCQICKQMLTEKLEYIGMLHSKSGQITHKNIHEYCDKYRFARNNSDTKSYKEIINKTKKDSSSSSEEAKNSPQLNKRSASKSQVDNDLNNFLDAFFGDSNKRGAHEVFSSESLNEVAGMREKRAASPTDPGFIGTRFYLSCTEKGTPVDGVLSLCTKCWAWRELPVNYFPRYVNELVCHESDTSCLSGYATCGSGTQQLDVLRNDSGTLVPISLAASTYCECQIKAGSTLEPLVFGAPNTSPLPGIPPANPTV